ncbi:MAG: T9SS type A sorting domain-containing protein [Flavobacteriaceae bacterium]|nr:T9SS type A sorting domain-containing protein [Flavobacteriaceae bacterium]
MIKNITSIKLLSLLVTCFCTVNFGFGQTTLAAGDIVITGVNSDDPDQLTFVILTDVSTGTTINFTDNGWQSPGSFRTGEGTITWTATSDLSCGTEITITDNSPFSASIGTVTDSNLFQLAVGGDQILAYQGLPASPTFIYAVHFASATSWTDATTANTSAVPTGLTNGTNALYIGNFDNGNYNCAVTSNQSLILASVSTPGNWNGDNVRLATLGGCSYTCVACPTSTTYTSLGGWSNGLPNSLTKAVIIYDNYDTSSGDISACSLTVSNNATLTVSDNTFVEVENEITVDAGSSFLVQPKAAVVQINDGATNSGTMTVVKTTAPLNAWYEYTYWSSPVSGETIGNALFFSDAGRRFKFNGQNSLDAYAETNNNNDGTTLGQDGIDDNGDDWQWVNGSTIMLPGVGYASTHSQDYFFGPGPFSTPPYEFDYIFTGLLNNGVYDVPVYRNDSELNDGNPNFIGNPYPSAISADLFFDVNAYDVVTNPTGVLDGILYLWSQNTPPSNTANGNEQLNFSTSDYAIINLSGETQGGDDINKDGFVDILDKPNRFIPSGQGFFVSMANNATASVFSGDVMTADVTFNNAMRVKGATDNSQFFKNSNTKTTTSNSNKLWVNLTSDNGVFGQTLVSYIDGATNNDDGLSYDAVKNLSAGAAAILYSTIEGSNKVFAIQGKASNSLNNDEVIKLGFNTNINVATLYTLSIPKVEGAFLTSNTVYLKDNLLNTLHDLSTSDYSFTSQVGEFTDRFEIVFNAQALSTNQFNLDANTIKISQVDDTHVTFKASNNLNIKTIAIFDLLGRQLYQLKGTHNEETYKLSNLNNAVFIAKVELSNGAVITKKAVKK